MNINAKVTMGIRNFFKKYGRIILIAFIIWLVIFLINQYLKSHPKIENSMITTYTPDTPVMDEGESVPERYKETINSTIDNYFKLCNTKDYENAYNMLTEQCKEYLYGNDISLFQQYVDSIFVGTKIYNLQNYSNINGKYIYDIIILDDIEATGTTNGYEPYREKITVSKENNEFKISNQGFIESIDYNLVSEDDNIKVTVKSKDVSYKREGYNVTITNKTDNYIVIVDNTLYEELTLNLGDQKRKATNYSGANLILNPGETTQAVFIFDKFYDDNKNPTEICLENVRILENYELNMEDTSGKAEKVYSFNMSLEK